jgi:hypothetical protein
VPAARWRILVAGRAIFRRRLEGAQSGTKVAVIESRDDSADQASAGAIVLAALGF